MEVHDSTQFTPNVNEDAGMKRRGYQDADPKCTYGTLHDYEPLTFDLFSAKVLLLS